VARGNSAHGYEPRCGLDLERDARSALGEVAETASSKQSSEHPTRWDLGGAGDGPVTAWRLSPRATGWYAEVEMDPAAE
jgi:hypothetical protein